MIPDERAMTFPLLPSSPERSYIRFVNSSDEEKNISNDSVKQLVRATYINNYSTLIFYKIIHEIGNHLFFRDL